jgi:wyosine [tRNA(Phe)-imidazoG37] synthetase (radical SAM superfamily)
VSALQAQRDIQQAVFGPYDSRRFGKSLGVNPLPPGARLCTFDCIYCECGPAACRPQFATAEEIRDALLAAAEVYASEELDTITIAGNGEPTLSPHLNAIVDVVCEARDRDWPQARTVILTNGTQCHHRSVQTAIAKLDERVIKLDAASSWVFEQMNRPVSNLSVRELLWRISSMTDFVVQSMFVHGPVDNTSADEIETWAGWLRDLKPSSVQIYSLDRVPAKNWVRRVPQRELATIADYVMRTTGIPAHVY